MGLVETKEMIKAVRAARRAEAVRSGNFRAYRMPGRTMPNKKREAARKACRGRVAE